MTVRSRAQQLADAFAKIMRILPESPDQTVLSRVRPRFFIQSGHETIYLDQYSLKRKSGGTLEAPRGVRQMNGAPQSGSDRSATA